MDFATALVEENNAFADALRGADPATPVTTCPGWTLKQLMRHVGRGDRWAAQIVADRLTVPLDPREVRNGKPPDDGAIEWLRGGAQQLVEAVQKTGGDTPVWTFIGPQPASWWIRRRLHEVTVHRADAELALGRDFHLAADLAADGLTEWLERVVLQAGGDGIPLSANQSLHLHAAGGGEWTLRSDGQTLQLSPQHEKATVAVRGDATSLLLAMLRRIPADDRRIAVFGDIEVWRGWLDHTPF
ncbi:MAG: maleylpyruvate isomerase family mycothiol-dependent enzyme [Mycobacterium sp.]